MKNHKVKKIHYSGGIVYSNGNRLPGWPCCCSGERANRIRQEGIQSNFINNVTCKVCLRMLDMQEAYRSTNPDAWNRSKEKGYCIEPMTFKQSY